MRKPIASRLVAGWTLIEIILMIAVGSILAIGATRAMQSQMSAVIQFRNYMVALHLAKRQMAILNNTAYASLTTASAADATFTSFTVATTVTTPYTSAAPAANVKKVVVEVSTPEDGILVQLNTYRTDVVSFGNGT